MKNSYILILISLIITVTGFASEESHKQSADRLLDAMNVNELLSESLEAMLQLELVNNPAMIPFEGTLRAFFQKHMSGESFREEIRELYLEKFTEPEINEITAFYETETGKKMLALTPELTARSADIGQQRVLNNIGELQQMIEAEALRIQSIQEETEAVDSSAN